MIFFEVDDFSIYGLGGLVLVDLVVHPQFYKSRMINYYYYVIKD